jgi:nucleotide-binding universal stress UspA family protein
MQRLMSDGGAQGIAHEGIIAEGTVWPMISETVKSRQIDLLAVGTHGKTNSKKLVLGPVAEEIYRMADCAILTVPPQIESTAEGEPELKQLLFAANFKPHNERAASIAHLLECRQQMKLTMVHVVEESGESSLPSQKLVEEFMINRMRKALPEGCVAECKPEFAVRFGRPAAEILATAKERRADLILLGLRAMQRTPGHLPSAIAYGIVCQSSCPVLTLHQ